MRVNHAPGTVSLTSPDTPAPPRIAPPGPHVAPPNGDPPIREYIYMNFMKISTQQHLMKIGAKHHESGVSFQITIISNPYSLLFA